MLAWNTIQTEYEELIQKLTDASLEQKTRGEMQKKASKLAELLELHKEMMQIEQRVDENQKMVAKEGPEFQELIEEENKDLKQQLYEAEKRLEEMLYPADERDKCSVFVEIRAGAGGQEAALFVADLFRMYSNYAQTRHWKVSTVDSSQTDLKGFKELIVHISGKGVYRYFKFESGVHRVQRVPLTETAGRIHTSTVTVTVLPELDDVEVKINPQDLRIDVFRSQGAGGQSVNTTDSAVRVFHIPTGMIVTCQDERSQIKNKAKALKVLQARLLELEQQKRDAEMSEQRKKQMGSGERSEKIRTYNFPQNRVSDHRIDLTLKKLDMVMEGDLDDLFMPLLEWELAERKKRGSLV